jgi:hypothetical protein
VSHTREFSQNGAHEPLQHLAPGQSASAAQARHWPFLQAWPPLQSPLLQHWVLGRHAPPQQRADHGRGVSGLLRMNIEGGLGTVHVAREKIRPAELLIDRSRSGLPLTKLLEFLWLYFRAGGRTPVQEQHDHCKQYGFHHVGSTGFIAVAT